MFGVRLSPATCGQFQSGYLSLNAPNAVKENIVGKPSSSLQYRGCDRLSCSPECSMSSNWRVYGSSTQSLFFHFARLYLDRLTPQNVDEGIGGPLHIFRPTSSRARRRVYNTTVKRVKAERAKDSPSSESASKLSPRGSGSRLYVRCSFSLRGLLSPSLRLTPSLTELAQRVSLEMRFSFRLPLLALGIALNLNIPVWLRVIIVTATLVIDGFLFRQSRHQFRNAHSMVAHSLADGTISTAALSDG